jgi:hypothetical protein
MMGKSCEDYQRLIKDQLAGELDASLEELLTQHLSGCAPCAQEARLLQGVWNELEAYEEEPVPNHFFVYEPERLTLGQVFTKLSFPWKLATASASVALVLVAALALLNASLKIESGAVVLTFGTARAESARFDSMKAELIDHLRAASREEKAEWVSELKNEFTSALGQSEQKQQALVKTALEELDGRNSRANQVRDAQLQSHLNASLKSFGAAMLARHDRDIATVNQQLTGFANYDRFQANQTDAIMTTLVEMAGQDPIRR